MSDLITPSSAPPTPAPSLRDALCPYCGTSVAASTRCPGCKGLLDPLSRQASTNSMGPWFIRDEEQPFRPGCSHDTLRILVARGRITPATIVRGPTTRQFWTHARRVQGLAHLLGVCHNCQATVAPSASECGSCGASFAVPSDRQQLGLGAMHAIPVPGGAPGSVAAGTLASAAPLPAGVVVVPPAPSPPPAPAAREEWGSPAQVPPADLDWAQAAAMPMDLTAGRSSSGAWVKLAVLGLVLLGAGAAAIGLLKKTWNESAASGDSPASIAVPVLPADAQSTAPDATAVPDAPASQGVEVPAGAPSAASPADPLSADPEYVKASALAGSERAAELDESLALLSALIGRFPAEAARLEAMSEAVRARRAALVTRGLP
jgi:hypothetical protein